MPNAGNIGGVLVIVGLAMAAASLLLRFESEGGRRADERRGRLSSPMYEAMGTVAAVSRRLGLVLAALGLALMIVAAL